MDPFWPFAIIFTLLGICQLALHCRQSVLEDECVKRVGSSGNWRRGYKSGGLWHLSTACGFDDFDKPAACGFMFPNEILEKNSDPNPRHRCETCQLQYVLEKVR